MKFGADLNENLVRNWIILLTEFGAKLDEIWCEIEWKFGAKFYEFWCEKFGAKLNIFGAKSYAKCIKKCTLNNYTVFLEALQDDHTSWISESLCGPQQEKTEV